MRASSRHQIGRHRRSLNNGMPEFLTATVPNSKNAGSPLEINNLSFSNSNNKPCAAIKIPLHFRSQNLQRFVAVPAAKASRA